MLLRAITRIVRRLYWILKKKIFRKEEPIFYYTLHQKLWNILAEHPGMLKKEALEEYFTEKERKKFGTLQCTACAYKWKIIGTDSDPDCKHCPLDTSHVPEEYPELSKWRDICLRGLFHQWDKLTRDIICATDNIDDIDVKRNKELCSKYARAIANLKPKEGVKYI